MGYDQNNEYYNSGDQSWRDQTNVYQTQREQPTPMGRRSPRRTGGWLKGILAVLLVVAISFGHRAVQSGSGSDHKILYEPGDPESKSL